MIKLINRFIGYVYYLGALSSWVEVVSFIIGTLLIIYVSLTVELSLIIFCFVFFLWLLTFSWCASFSLIGRDSEYPHEVDYFDRYKLYRITSIVRRMTCDLPQNKLNTYETSSFYRGVVLDISKVWSHLGAEFILTSKKGELLLKYTDRSQQSALENCSDFVVSHDIKELLSLVDRESSDLA